MLSAWDARLLVLINVSLHHPLVMAGMSVLTRAGETPIILILAVVSGAWAWSRCRREVVGGGLGLVAAVGVAAWVKGVVHRPRPAEVLHGLWVWPGAHGPSFPSGHATAAFGLAAALSVWWPRGRAVWWTFAVGVAWSRLVLGVHWPSDCVAGAVLGAGLVWAAIGIKPSSRENHRTSAVTT